MSGRHKMPPAGRRKALAESAESAEQTTPETETVEDAIEEPAQTVEAVETEVDAEVEPDVEDEVESDAEDEVADDGAADDEDEVVDEAAETEEPLEKPAEAAPSRARRRVSLPVALGVIALVLALASGVLRWLIVRQEESDRARDESVQAAKDITIEMLSYETETVEQQLNAARERMTGNFLGTYTAMINDIIPAAKAQQIAAVAEVLRTGSVSSTPDSAEMVLFVNQSVQVGNHMPQKTPSVVRVTVVKEGDRWLLSEYEPVPL